ncbi:MFS transporter [Oligoflexus sp.]|uniref:MFS transporter n=1 Tax=Oligoflexus sp. TaxID=1971216 RepID=UPI0039C9D342
MGVLNFTAIPGHVLLIPLFKQDPALGMTLYGFFMSAFAVGMIAGGFVCAKLDRRWHYTLVCCSTLSFNIGYLGIALGTSHWMILLSGFGMGICLSFSKILFNSVILARVDQEFVGRIFSLLGFLSGFLTPVSMLASGYLGETFPKNLLRYGGLPMGIAGVYCWQGKEPTTEY